MYTLLTVLLCALCVQAQVLVGNEASLTYLNFTMTQFYATPGIKYPANLFFAGLRFREGNSSAYLHINSTAGLITANLLQCSNKVLTEPGVCAYQLTTYTKQFLSDVFNTLLYQASNTDAVVWVTLSDGYNDGRGLCVVKMNVLQRQGSSVGAYGPTLGLILTMGLLLWVLSCLSVEPY